MTFITKIENLFHNHALVPEAKTLETKFKAVADELETLLPDGDLKTELFDDLAKLSTKAHAIVAETGDVTTNVAKDVTELETAPATVENTGNPETSVGMYPPVETAPVAAEPEAPASE